MGFVGGGNACTLTSAHCVARQSSLGVTVLPPFTFTFARGEMYVIKDILLQLCLSCVSIVDVFKWSRAVLYFP